jgi:hypothetical protein
MTAQDTNGINELCDSEDGVDRTEALAVARCLRDYTHRHGEANQSFDVLKALATLTVERIEQGKNGLRFTAVNILTTAEIPIPEGKQAGSKLSPIWKKLIETMSAEREQGIQDFARNAGLQYYPWPEKVKTEGGRPSQYYVNIMPLSEIDGLPSSGPTAGEIAYIRELTPDPSWWAKPLLKNGYRLEGWRRWLFVAYGIGSILMAAAILILLWSLLERLPTWSIKDISTALFIAAALIFFIGAAINPIIRLLDWRIVMAPAGLVALKELNVQMEITRENQTFSSSPGTIRLVRYASTCPLCHAKIELDDGRKEFPNRLIGRCKENPAEHVYSFDRFTCRGRSLR